MSKLRKEITLEYMNDHSRECLTDRLGIEMLTLEEGVITSRMQVQPWHLAKNGFLHAASIIALADTSIGAASLAHLPKGADNFTTIELKSNFLHTLREGTIFCTATAQHLGRMTQIWDAVVSDEASGKTLALFRCTQIILWPAAE